MEWEERRTDGSGFVLLSSFGKVYARFPMEAAGTAFGGLSGSSLPAYELQWLVELFSPEGLLTDLRRGYEKITRGSAFTFNHIPVQTVIAHKDANAQRQASELILTIGTADHRLYQTQHIDHYATGDSVETITYHALKVNPALADSLFATPKEMKRLTPMDVLAVTPESIILSNKEHKAKAGDRVFLFQGWGFRPYVTGDLVITKVNKDRCEAEAAMIVSIRPGHHGFLLPRR